MAEILLLKTPDGVLHPLDEVQAEELKKFKAGTLLRCEIIRVRNPRFHRKFFALLGIGFDAFEPAVTEHQGFEVQKNFQQFREDVTIAAGYYVVTANIHGAVKVRAKSISFSSMSQDEFEKLYNAVANVLLQKILSRYTRDDLDRVVDQIMAF